MNTNTKKYIVKVSSAQQTKQTSEHKIIPEVPYAVTMHGSFNESRGLLYMHEYHVKARLHEALKSTRCCMRH